MNRTIICSLALALSLPAVASGAAGEVTYLDGGATRTPQGGAAVALAMKGEVEQGDIIETGPKGKVEVTLGDKSVLRLGPGSKLKVETAAFSDKDRDFKATLMLGKVWSKVTSVFGDNRGFEVKTERAVAGVRGTIFRVDADKTKAVLVRVYAGTVAVAGQSPKAAAPPPVKKGERVQIAGPSEVSRKEWEKVVGAMMQVKVTAAGEASEPTKFSEADEAKDAWAAWNRQRDTAAQ